MAAITTAPREISRARSSSVSSVCAAAFRPNRRASPTIADYGGSLFRIDVEVAVEH
jgi:hypothetical protein